MAFILQGGNVVDFNTGDIRRLDVVVEKDRIAGIIPENEPAADSRPSHVINISGMLLVPGLIDMHTHLREPGQEYKETIESGCAAAAAGGFTAVACMPNTIPCNDTPELTEHILEKSKNAKVRVFPVGAISKNLAGKELVDFAALKNAGAAAFSDDGRAVMDSSLMCSALKEIKKLGSVAICHSEDMSLSSGGVINDGSVSRKLGLKGIPSSAESIMVYRDVSLADYTGCHVHIAHVSTAESVFIIKRAKEQGIHVTAETAPHYWSLNEDAVFIYGSNAKMNPPLRTKSDVKAVRDGLSDGTIDIIATDHAPHSSEEKNKGLPEAPFGITGLETALPLALSLVKDNVLSLDKMISKMTILPADILGIDGGLIKIGALADLTVIDLDYEFILQPEDFISKSSNSPFAGSKLTGKAMMTFVGGNRVW